MVNILLADDNTNFLNNLFKYIIRGNKKLRVVDITTDGISTYNSILELKPDIVILDLKMPKMNGIEILEKIQKHNATSKIIILSGYNDYIERIVDNKNIALKISKTKDFHTILKYVNVLADELEYDNREKEVSKTLKKISFNMNSIGSKYLIKAIMIALDDEKLLNRMENNLYSIIAKQFNTTNQNVKWNINRSIKSMWRYTDNKKYVSEVFGKNEINCPTAKDIISTSIDIFK